jgi:hypothetical protein
MSNIIVWQEEALSQHEARCSLSIPFGKNASGLCPVEHICFFVYCLD